MSHSPQYPDVDPPASARGASILLLDASDPTAELLRRNLDLDGYQVTVSDRMPRERSAAPSPEIALVNLASIDHDGWLLLAALRNAGPRAAWDATIPVLALCPADDPHAMVRALDYGADDALVIPFDYRELRARIGAQVRRRNGVAPGAQVAVGPIVIDRRAHQVSVNGAPMHLAEKEYALLMALARDPNRVVSKEELLRDVWGFRSTARTRTVDTHASRLRRKLVDHGCRPGMVANVWGIGYRLVTLDA